VQKIVNGTSQTKKRRDPKQTTARKPKQRGKTSIPGTSRGQTNSLADSSMGEEIAPNEATDALTGAPRGELPSGKYILFPAYTHLYPSFASS
jgi:hypothetical protein